MRVVTIAVALLLAAAAPARAGTLRVTTQTSQDGKSSETFATAEYVAGPGERNDVTVTRDGAAIHVADPGGTIVAGPGCTAGGTCTAPAGVSEFGTLVETQDGDDAVTIEDGVFAAVAAGSGDDRLTVVGPDDLDALAGGPGDDVLTGGDGEDLLSGGQGSDVIHAGGGDDVVHGADEGSEPEPDRIDGGDGEDTLDYGGRLAPLRIDLARGTAAEDAVSGIENAVGGSGHDVIAGDDGPNELRGDDDPDSDAGDTLLGRGGDDDLEGDAGADDLRGGAGDDGIHGGEGDDRYDGGAGRDIYELDDAGRRDRVEIFCDAADETELPFIGTRAVPVLHSGCARVVTANGVRLTLHRDRSGRIRSLGARWVRNGLNDLSCRVQARFVARGRVIASATAEHLSYSRTRTARVRHTGTAPGRVTVRVGTGGCHGALKWRPSFTVPRV